MPTRIMYCPQCDRKLEIKENTKLDGSLCPLCNEAELQTAGVTMTDYIKGYYRWHDFHIEERKN